MNMKVDPGAREDSGRMDGAAYEGAYLDMRLEGLAGMEESLAAKIAAQL